MLLYTIQSLEVMAYLYTHQIYYPSFDRCDMLIDDDFKAAFEEPYKWMTEQYNKRKKTKYISAPVWWRTDYKETVQAYNRSETGYVLIKAHVPDKLVLFHDADLWEIGPFVNVPLGWIVENEKFFDALWDLHKKNHPATIQTWENIFNISNSNPPECIHATTQYIDISWLERFDND